jgi:hypothetical protein
MQSVRLDTLGFRRHLEKVAAALSVVSSAAPLRSCEGPLVAQSGRSGLWNSLFTNHPNETRNLV